jgi:hypothetical protein
LGPRSYRRGVWSSLLLAPVGVAFAAGPALVVSAAAPTTTVAAEPAAAVSPAVPALVQLPAVPAQGQAAALSTTITHIEPAGTFIWTIDVSAQVIHVEGGGYTTRSTITTIDETRPEADAAAASPFDTLFSVSFEQVFAANGSFQQGTIIDAGNLSPEQLSAGEAVLDTMAMASVGFPSEPIAVGASWTSPSTVGTAGIQTSADVQCRLTSLAADSYSVDISYSTSAAGQTPEGWVDATVSGWGTFTGSLTNPLIVNGTLNQTVDGVLTMADGSSMPWNEDTSIAVSSTGL